MIQKRGLSAVVITLIMILLALVVAGAIWVVVNNLTDAGTEQIEQAQLCSENRVEVVSASCDATTTPESCGAIVKRTQGTETISGVKVLFEGSDGTTVVEDFTGDIASLATGAVSSVDVSDIGAAEVVQVSAAVYFTDAAGNEVPCSAGTTFDEIQLTTA